MFEADWKPSSWDDEDGQRRHLADGDPVTPTPAPTPAPAPAPAPAAPCKGKLTPAKDPKKIEFAFSALKTPQYSDILASSFFVNKDSAKCPITKCAMMG